MILLSLRIGFCLPVVHLTKLLNPYFSQRMHVYIYNYILAGSNRYSLDHRTENCMHQSDKNICAYNFKPTRWIDPTSLKENTYIVNSHSFTIHVALIEDATITYMYMHHMFIFSCLLLLNKDATSLAKKQGVLCIRLTLSTTVVTPVT